MVKNKIPQNINLIWFGSWPPGGEKHQQDYLRRLKEWKSKNPAYSVKLWTDKTTMSGPEYEALIKFCEENDITVADINSEEYQQYPNINHVKEWLQVKDVGNHRYAAASDVLRTSVLYKEGGHYFDFDVEQERPLSEKDWAVEGGTYQVFQRPTVYSDESYFCYCIMGTAPHHPIYRRANQIYDEAHDDILRGLKQQIEAGNSIDKTRYIISTSGRMLTRAAEKEIADESIELCEVADTKSVRQQFSSGILSDALSFSYDKTYSAADEHNNPFEPAIKPVLARINTAQERMVDEFTEVCQRLTYFKDDVKSGKNYLDGTVFIFKCFRKVRHGQNY